MIDEIELTIIDDKVDLPIIHEQYDLVVDDDNVPLTIIQDNVGLDVGVEYIDKSAPTYTGEYEFFPGEEDQVVQISGKKAAQNILVHAVPENYARMSFSGNVITFY